MEQNIDIYLIGLSVLIFLIITFLFIRKISSSGELKVKIEPVTDSFEIKEIDEIEIKSQKAFDFNEHELAFDMRTLREIDKLYHVDQLIEVLSNLLDFALVATCHDSQARQRIIFGWRHRKRVDVVAPLREKPDNARESSRLIFH